MKIELKLPHLLRDTKEFVDDLRHLHQQDGMRIVKIDIKEFYCESWKRHTMCKCALCTVDDSGCFHDIRLGPKTSVNHVKVIVVSTALRCDVTYCATTLQGFNKHACSRREAVRFARRPSLH